MLEFRLLGPIEVVADGMPVELGKGLERALLAMLVLSAGRSVSGDELQHALWPGQVPATAPEMIRNVVARLRGRLGHDAIETTPAGYRLTAHDDQVDARRFELLAASGSDALARGEAEQAAALLSEALSLWRGRAAPELDDVIALVPTLGALEELRLQTEEDRLEAELVLGRASFVVRELDLLHEAHPYRERVLGQLMLALYRSGRQKDALDRYAEGRRRLVEDVGLEPGPALQELQVRILQQDPGLRGAAPTEPGVPPLKGKGRHLPLIVAATVLAAATSATAIAWPHHTTPTIPTRGVVALDEDGRVKAAMPLSIRPGVLAIDARHVWVAAAGRPTVVELSSDRPSQARNIRISRTAFSVAVAGGSLWVGNGFDGAVSRIDEAGRLRSTFRPEPGSRGRLPLASAGNRLWVASQDATLTELNAASGQPIHTYDHVGLAEAIAVAGNVVWIADATSDVVERFDARAGRVVKRIPIGGRATAVVVDDGAVWALTPGDNTLWRIDTKQDAVSQSISVPSSATSLAAAPGRVWVASSDGLMSLIDTETDAIAGTRSLKRPVNRLARYGTEIWVSIG